MESTASPGPPRPWTDFLRSERSRLERLGLRRSVVTPESRDGIRACLGGREYVLFTSNDYLGLAAHPEVIAAAGEAARRFGAGAGSARLLHGSTPLHENLQERIARLTGQQSSLLFSSGYMANLGLLAALAGNGDAIFYDERAHASIIDGARLSRAAALPYPHNDAGGLDDLLRGTPARRRMVVTESVFSMDGDMAPLEALGETASRHDALLVVDEAHAIGIFGAGSVLLGSFDDIPAVVTGTLSKSLGSVGGFVAGDRTLVEFLIDRARTFIFDTALPPSAVAAAAAALDVAQNEPWRRKRVLELGGNLRSSLNRLGYPPSCSDSQIVPVLLGRPSAAVAAEEHLKAHGILARAVRPPAVPRGTSRIRFGVTASHEGEHLRQVAAAMESLRG